jgi:hypothetical protein
MSLSPSPVHPARKPWPRWLVRLLIFGLPLLIIFLLWYRSLAPKTCHLNMLVDVDPNRNLVAQKIKKEGKRHGIDVHLSTDEQGLVDKKTVGDLDAIDLVDKPNPIDIALVPGGVAKREYDNVRQVAALSQEPLQLLARAEIVGEGISWLKGRRVCVGPDTASTHYIALDVLAFAGLHATNDNQPGQYKAETTSPEDLQEQLNKIRELEPEDRKEAIRKLPDAVFILSTLPSLLAHNLVELGDYRLVPLPFADAYCQDRIRDPETRGVRIDRGIFAPFEIPPFTYGVEPAVPAKPCRTIATRLLLIAYSPTDMEGVNRLTDTIFDGAVAGLVQPLNMKDHSPQFPLHTGTERWMRRHDPLLSPELAASLGKLAGGVGAFVSAMIAIYSLMRLRQLRRFEAYYKEIRRLELIARGQEIDPAAPVDPDARRAYLEDRLLDLKSRALADFANGGLRGEGLMVGIVSLVNDTRASLARLHAPSPNDGSAVHQHV